MAMLNWKGWELTNFQGWGSAGTATPVVTTAVGHVGKPKRKREYVEIDGQYFEVRDQKQAIEILTKLHEAAQEAAPVAAKAALAKAPAKPVVVAPKMAVVKPDYSKEFVQQLQAQVDAANAQIAETYRQALATELLAAAQAYKRRIDDEDDEIIALVMLGIL